MTDNMISHTYMQKTMNYKLIRSLKQQKVLFPIIHENERIRSTVSRRWKKDVMHDRYDNLIR